MLLDVSIDCKEFEKSWDEEDRENIDEPRMPRLTRDALMNRIMNEELDFSDRLQNADGRIGSVSAPASVNGNNQTTRGRDYDVDNDLYSFNDQEIEDNRFRQWEMEEEEENRREEWERALVSEIEVTEATDYRPGMVSVVTRFLAEPEALETAQMILKGTWQNHRSNTASKSISNASSSADTRADENLSLGSGSLGLRLFEKLEERKQREKLKNHSNSGSDGTTSHVENEEEDQSEYEQIHDFAIFEAILEIFRKWSPRIQKEGRGILTNNTTSQVSTSVANHRRGAIAFKDVAEQGSKANSKSLSLLKIHLLQELQRWDQLDTDAEATRRNVYVENGTDGTPQSFPLTEVERIQGTLREEVREIEKTKGWGQGWKGVEDEEAEVKKMIADRLFDRLIDDTVREVTKHIG
eukprot:g94.t1